MKKTAFAALLAGVLLTPAAIAESELYVTGGYSVIDGDGATLDALTIRGGWMFTEMFGAELEGSFGIGSDDVDGFPGAEIELNNQFGGYLVGRFPVAEQFDVIGRLGYTTGEFEASGGGFSDTADVDGFAFGIGGEFMFTDTFGVRGDYTRIEADDDDLDGGVDVFAISGVLKFGAPQ